MMRLEIMIPVVFLIAAEAGLPPNTMPDVDWVTYCGRTLQECTVFPFQEIPRNSCGNICRTQGYLYGECFENATLCEEYYVDFDEPANFRCKCWHWNGHPPIETPDWEEYGH